MHSFESPYFAAIDLGSNSFHMLIVRLKDARIEIVDREKDMVQIARGMKKDGNLSSEAQERAISCLERFSERLRDIPESQIRAVGTKTLRAAKNSKQFLRAATKALGQPIQIVSGYEEARLVYSGLSHSVTDLDRQRLVIDIGGGSTEFVIGKGYDPILLESIGLGCVTFAEKFMAGGVNDKSMRKAYDAACGELEHIRKNYLKEGWEVTFGTSGTMKAIASLLEDEDGGAIITRNGLTRLAKDTTSNHGISISSMPKLRRDVLPAGIAILQAIFDELKIDTLRVGDATLKEGLIYDTIGRLSDHDVRFDTVARLQKQYSIDKAQATRISSTALSLWRQISAPNLPGVSRTKILDWAAQLQEIGLNISHSSHHHHGHYIIRHSDLAGFGRYEQYILANLVRYHRKKINLDQLGGLNEAALAGFLPLLACLRIAVVLHRRREDIEVAPVLEFEDTKLKLSFPDNWLPDHPLTQAGLEQEASYLKAIDMKLTIK